MTAIYGQKAGGSDSHTPVESPDSLIANSFAKMLLVLGHGEWVGGLDNTRIFLDGTPIGNADGSINFPGVKWEFRPGTQHQTYIPGLPNVENDIAIGVELKQETPWIKAIANTDLSAVRVRLSWPALQQQLDNGDVVGYRVEYAIDLATSGGAFVEVLRTAADGKSTTGYLRSHRIDLPTSTEGWQVRVRRITPNTTNTARVADRMLVDAIVEIVDAKLRYPNLALLYIQFDAKQFQNIPAITCKPKMNIIRVPSNYDPTTRTYTGSWDGLFKWAWTNNPAWIFYDICLNEEYGLGQWIKANNLSMSKWDLYDIAKYCDELVPDGRGGTEPRHLCDVYIQGQADAINVLSDIISIFNGMFYWASGEITALADMSRSVDLIYSNASVKGDFQYSSASERTHYSQAMVSYSNPDNRYQDDIEPVSIRALVKRYGTQNADITAIGCTRRSEAIRRGKWVLYTNDKDRAVSFTVGLEGRIPLPGYVIGVADRLLAGRALGGRISSAMGRNVTLDRKPDTKAGDRLIINLPSGVAQARTVQSVNEKVVTVSVAYSESPAAECGWSVDANDLAVQLYRVVGIKDASTDKEIAYEINAIEYDENKWAKIESGAIIEDRPISVIPPGVQPPPKNIEITSFSAIAQGLSVTTLHVEWNAAESAIAYEAEWRRDNGNWISVPRTSTRSFDVTGIYVGRYQCRVRAINAAEISSIWGNAIETALNGKEGNPPMPVGFAASGILFGITLNWGYPAGAEDALKTEIEYSLSADGTDTMLLSDVPHPQRSYTMLGLRAGQVFWFHARIVDKSGNQSPWTDWIRGMSSNDTSAILDFIGDDFINNTEAGRQLFDNDFMHAEAILENAVANDAGIVQQWAQFGENKAGVIHLTTTVADVERAFAEFETLVTATLEGQTAAIDEKLTAVVDSSGASATYSLRAGINYNGNLVNAGMVIGAEFINGVAKSSIGFTADQFILLSGPEGNISSPFAVVNGQTFMNEAFIAKASIGRGNITDTLDSDNYVQGMSGLHLDFKNGYAEFNSVNIRGNITMDNTINGIRTILDYRGQRTYHANGQPALICGYF
ncbi:host specificity protein J [Yersinia rohdei]|uniref:host specificity protein J n=1 Tax=Yersinia rohdei TaxID=29485 RepID=UPI0011A69A4F|nr:host specificity protein J [Yersinia rohdei]